VGRKPTGTLVVDYLRPGKRLYMLATGTGLAPFLSIVRDPEVYERFESIVLVHGVRQVEELAYHEMLTEHLPKHEYLGEVVSSKLRYLPTVTRQPFHTMGRIPKLIRSGELAAQLQLPELAPEHDRVMICGSPAMLRELKGLLEERGFDEGNTSMPGDFVIERAFAEQ
jgi:ferredoxin--NADP+ reductase